MSGLARIARSLEIGWIDVLIAVGLSVLSVAEGASSGSEPFAPAVLLCTAPLLVRRRWPIPVLMLALAGFIIAGNAGNLASLAGGLTAAVSVGLDEEHPVLGTLAVLVVAGAIAFDFGQGGDTQLPIPGYLAPFLMIGSAFLAGRVVADRQAQTRQARDRAGRLEHERDEAITAATEAERRRIARELHDVVAHSVGVMVVQAGAARHVLDEKPEAARESLVAVEETGHEAMAELRRLLGVLTEDGEPVPLLPEPGIEQVGELVERVKEAGLPVELSVQGHSRPLAPGVEVAVYRILQEALTNALKYAGGATTRAVLRFSPEAIEVEVVDDGPAATPAAGVGRGLTGMRERVALFGGTIETGRRRDGGGYSVRARLPLTSPD